MPEPLDPIERRIYHFLLDYLAEHTFQPSVREIGRRFRIASTKTVADLLKQLEMKGYIERGKSRSRGVRLVGYAGPVGTQPVPVYARAHAAPPTLRRADIIEHITLDRRLLPSEDAFLTRVVGHATAARGLLDGDLAIVNPSGRAADGDAVALRIDEWIHVRAVHRRGRELHVEESPPLVLGPGDDYAVLGAVTGAVRGTGSGDRGSGN